MRANSRRRKSESSRIERIIDIVSSNMHLPSPYQIYAAMGAVVGNHMQQQPAVWLMLVGPSASGKTMTLETASKIHGLKECGNITGIAAFISAAKMKGKLKPGETAPTGGLLYELPLSKHPGERFGMLTTRDFTTILSANQDRRTEIVAVLREVADGRWSRSYGIDGGNSAEWKGKAGFLGACTEAIDNHFAIIQELGQRWVYWRFPNVQDQYRIVAMTLIRKTRVDVSEYIAEFMLKEGLEEDMDYDDADLTHADRDRLNHLVHLTSAGRVIVRRNAYDKSDHGQPQFESPARVAANIINIYRGMTWLGIDKSDKWKVIYRICLDSIPGVRSSAIKLLATAGTPLSAPEVSALIRCGSTTATVTLQDLELAGLAVRQDEPTRGSAMKWVLSPGAHAVLDRVKTFIAATDEQYQDVLID